MSNAGRKKIKAWDGAIECEKPAPNTTVGAIKASIDERLIAFEQHKKELLKTLSSAYEGGPKSEPFNTDETWRYLTSLASQYFQREWVKQRATKPAERQAQLCELAKTLKRARDMISEATQSDIGNDLVSAWWDADPTPAPFGNDSEQLDLVDLRIFDKTGALLATLESVALRAAAAIPTKRGRPKGTANLPWDFVATLGIIYRQSTGLKPGASSGPFARFVEKFLAAIGRSYCFESVVDDIKNSRVRAQNSSWSSSPFDKQVEE
jgi:hypothetical protein